MAARCVLVVERSPMPASNGPAAADAGTVDVGGDLTVNRLGFGAMRVTGRGIWGDPPDRNQARAVLRRAVERSQLHRHCGLIRPGRERGAHRRGASSVSGGSGHRDQGRTRPPRPRTVGSRRPARTFAAGMRGQPATPAVGSDRLVSVPSARRTCRSKTRSALWSR